MQVSAFNLPLSVETLRQAAYMSRLERNEEDPPDAVMSYGTREHLLAHNHPDIRFQDPHAKSEDMTLGYWMSGIKLCVDYRMPQSSVIFLDHEGRAVGWITDIAVPKEGPDGIPKV